VAPAYILAIWEAEIRRILSLRPDWANSLKNFISKITRAKWTGGMAQAIECLLCKCKALSSNTSSTKKRKKDKLESLRTAVINRTACSVGLPCSNT
jgi:hypothetical protein